jgi:hypothetical protein
LTDRRWQTVQESNEVFQCWLRHKRYLRGRADAANDLYTVEGGKLANDCRVWQKNIFEWLETDNSGKGYQASKLTVRVRWPDPSKQIIYVSRCFELQAIL